MAVLIADIQLSHVNSQWWQPFGI